MKSIILSIVVLFIAIVVLAQSTTFKNHTILQDDDGNIVANHFLLFSCDSITNEDFNKHNTNNPNELSSCEGLPDYWPCDDGNPCTHSDHCLNGECIGIPYTCSDGHYCTSDYCNGDGGCVFTVNDNYCFINDVCYQNGDVNPNNPCEFCIPAWGIFYQTHWAYIEPEPPTCPPYDTVCITSDEFELTGGSPEGGEYSYGGQVITHFNPSVMGFGTHNINYLFYYGDDCFNFCSFSITVDSCEIPSISTIEVSDVTLTSAISGGEILNDGGAEINSRGVVWSTFETPTIALNEGMTSDGPGPGVFISEINNLNFSTTYYLRAYATNSVGTAYGEEINFTTLTPTPRQQDSLALVAFFESTGGTNWLNNDNWLTGPLSTWHGITMANNRVAELLLPANNLQGTLPGEMGDLIMIERIILIDNELSGGLPAELSNLSSLYELLFSSNDFYGTIPAVLGNATSLEILSLDDNNFSGIIPDELVNLQSLMTLDLNTNQLDGPFPSWLCDQMPNLTDLYLSYNNFGLESCTSLDCIINRGGWGYLSHSPQNNGFIYPDDCTQCEDAIADAGENSSLCEGTDLLLNGFAENYSTLEWTTSGDGIFDDPALTNPVYTPGITDVQNGVVQLCLTAYAVDTCVDATDCIEVIIIPLPKGGSGPDFVSTYPDEVFMANAWAEDYIQVNWTAETGDGSFDNPALVNPIYFPAQADLTRGYVKLSIEIEALDPCNETLTSSVFISFFQQMLDIESGWSGISAFIDPADPEMESIFGGSENFFEVLYNFNGVFIPGQQTNSLGNWNPESGYIIKANQDFQLPLMGAVTDGGSIENPSGWNIIPVLTTNPVSPAELFPEGSTMVIVKEVAGPGVYWPDYNINTLGDLMPGKAYFILYEEVETLEFPPGTETWECGQPFSDLRDGQLYGTVQIGYQCWMADNLNAGIMINGDQEMLNNSITEKYCYDNDSTNCSVYGGLYQWDEMMRYVEGVDVAGICPEGWHIPNDNEWKILEGMVDSQYGVGYYVWNNFGTRGFDAGKNLKASYGWYENGNGTDDFGFKAMPGGLRFYDGTMNYLTRFGVYWSSSEYSDNSAIRRLFSNSIDKIDRGYLPKVGGRSVRCVKNTIQPCPGTPTVSDNDGNVYNTVLIGNQCWMKENLNTGVMIYGSINQSNNEILEKHCYDDDFENCNTYGGLYQWDEMMHYSQMDRSNGICPDGWHIPTDEEWKVLEGNIDSQFGVGDPEWDLLNTTRGFDAGLHIKSPGGWVNYSSGSDKYGFTAFPGGNRDADSLFYGLGVYTSFWTSTEFDSLNALDHGIFHTSDEVARYENSKLHSRAVRCLRYLQNQPPGMPSSSFPANNAQNVSLQLELTWECTDPENDPLTFDLYFGQDNPPELYASGLGFPSMDFDSLEPMTNYFWEVVAHDDQGNATAGPIWTFTTETPSWTCGSLLLDERDQKTYETVQIGDQCWMAENLNIGIRVDGFDGQVNNGVYEKFCFDNDPTFCDTYGGLYQWDEAMQYTTDTVTQGICPDGWHMPTDAEWCILEQFAEPTISCTSFGWRGADGGGKLKEQGTSHWQDPNTGGTNATGFTALPGGCFDYRGNGSFEDLTVYGYWWTTASSSNYSICRNLEYSSAQINRNDFRNLYGFSVRCVKD